MERRRGNQKLHYYSMRTDEASLDTCDQGRPGAMGWSSPQRVARRFRRVAHVEQRSCASAGRTDIGLDLPHMGTPLWPTWSQTRDSGSLTQAGGVGESTRVWTDLDE